MITNSSGFEVESAAFDHLYRTIPDSVGDTWVQCSRSGKFRKHFPTIGYTWDASRDAFIPPKPYSQWVWNETTFTWEPPTAYPDDGRWTWSEDSGAWVEIYDY